jgi:hypothetical protein
MAGGGGGLSTSSSSSAKSGSNATLGDTAFGDKIIGGGLNAATLGIIGAVTLGVLWILKR